MKPLQPDDDELIQQERDEEEYYQQQEEYKWRRNRIHRLEKASFDTQRGVWNFFSLAWLSLLSKIRSNILHGEEVTLENHRVWIAELPKIGKHEDYGPLSDEELLSVAQSIQNNQKVATRLGERRSQLLNKKNERYSISLEETYNEAFLPHYKTIKALVLTWLHEASFRVNSSTPVWNFVSFYYTCMGFAATTVRVLDSNLGQLDGHNHIWRQYTSKVLKNAQLRNTLTSPYKGFIDQVSHNAATIDMFAGMTPFFGIIREFENTLHFAVIKKHPDEIVHFFHFVHYLSEYYRYQNILPVLFTRNPKYTQLQIQLNGLCDYQMMWLETILIMMLSPEVIEFFMYNFLCRNKEASHLKRRYRLFQGVGLLPVPQKRKIPYGGHEILDELIRYSEMNI